MQKYFAEPTKVVLTGDINNKFMSSKGLTKFNIKFYVFPPPENPKVSKNSQLQSTTWCKRWYDTSFYQQRPFLAQTSPALKNAGFGPA